MQKLSVEVSLTRQGGVNAADKSRIRWELMKLAHVGERSFSRPIERAAEAVGSGHQGACPHAPAWVWLQARR
jgi:hypothetical protein